MKNNSLKSFRLQIVIYSFLSLFYTVITVTVLLLGVGIVYFSLGGEIIKPVETMIQKNEQAQLGLNYIGNSELNNSYNLGVQQSTYLDHSMTFIVTTCTIILAVILFIVYFLKLTRKFNTYISEITEGIDEMTQGNFDYRIKVSGDDELAQIAEKINNMSKAVNTIIEEHRHCEDRKHELITAVAHDIRTPLTSVIGYLELLRSSKVDDETKNHYTEIVYGKAKRLEQLIEDLFSYTKYTYGDIATINEPVDVVKLLEQLIDEFYPAFEESHLSYQFYKDCASLVSYADGNLLARAFANLIANAIKYGADGKRVELYFIHKSDSMQILIKNYGTTIPEKDIPYIFDRFYRVEESRSQETGGSGLGLAIAKSIVTMHYGEITAKSDLDGTVFEVNLPIIQEPEDKQRKAG